MENCVNDRQTAQTDELQVMTSHRSCTSQSHKQITQNKMTSHQRMEMMNNAFGCSRATQVRMEDLRPVNLTEIFPSRRVGHFLAPYKSSGWMKMRVNNQTKIADDGKLTNAQ